MQNRKYVLSQNLSVRWASLLLPLPLPSWGYIMNDLLDYFIRLDPLIGQGARIMSGLDPLNEEQTVSMPTFIVPRGGEYFFSPSLNGLKGTIATPA